MRRRKVQSTENISVTGLPSVPEISRIRVNHSLKVFCRHAWFIWVNEALCKGEGREPGEYLVRMIYCVLSIYPSLGEEQHLDREVGSL